MTLVAPQEKYWTYPGYKDSGVEWLGRVPSHWEVRKVKHFLNEVNEPSLTGNEELLSVSEYYGVKPRHQVIGSDERLSRSESLVGYKICRAGDIVINIMLAWKCGLGVSDYDGIVSPAYAVFRPHSEVSSRFIHYLLRSPVSTTCFKRFSTGVIDSRLRLYPEVFLGLPLIFPPPSEQTAIANFLDRECGRMDKLIEKKQRFIELLKEKRQALITHAVTKGLNPNVELKDSGIEWLGMIPKHWEVKRLRHIAAFNNSNVDKKSYDGQQVVRLCNYTNVYYNEFIVNGMDFMEATASEAEIEKFQLRKGQVIITKDSEDPSDIGIPSLVTEDFDDVICGYHLTVIFPSDYDLGRYLHRSIQSMHTRAHFYVESPGITRYGLNQDAIGNIPVALPPEKERRTIVAQIDHETTRTDRLILKTIQSIDLLKERKTALITAAVTGQIDVRDVA